jgi:hypothetical protein
MKNLAKETLQLIADAKLKGHDDKLTELLSSCSIISPLIENINTNLVSDLFQQRRDVVIIDSSNDCTAGRALYEH